MPIRDDTLSTILILVARGGEIMDKVINRNCKRCVEYQNGKCSGDQVDCICRFCPRNLSICMKVRWCRETESQIVIDEE